MSISRIAAGVFLGNLLFALVAGIVLAIVTENRRQEALVHDVDQSYQEMQSRLKRERYERCLLASHAPPVAGGQPHKPCSLD